MVSRVQRGTRGGERLRGGGRGWHVVLGTLPTAVWAARGQAGHSGAIGVHLGPRVSAVLGHVLQVVGVGRGVGTRPTHTAARLPHLAGHLDRAALARHRRCPGHHGAGHAWPWRPLRTPALWPKWRIPVWRVGGDVVVVRGPWGVLGPGGHGRWGALGALWGSWGKVLGIRLHYGPLRPHCRVLVTTLVRGLAIGGPRGCPRRDMANLGGVVVGSRGRPRGHVWGAGARGVARGVHVATAAVTLTTAGVGGHHHTPWSSHGGRHMRGVRGMWRVGSCGQRRRRGHPHSRLVCWRL